MVYVDELPCDESGYMIVRIRISDTGIGMSQDYLTKIFEAFTREKNTTKSKIAGTGLGMSIVKNYVDLLGGTIDVESELGKGSTFTVTLKHRIADERYYVKKHIEESGTGNEILEGRNILLAEDNDLNAAGKKFTENYKEKHTIDAMYGWYRYESRFALPVFNEVGEIERYNVFNVIMVIRHAKDGKMYLYDIMNIKKETRYPSWTE